MILKNPTWSGLHPGLPDFIPVDVAKSQILQCKTNIIGTVYQASFEGELSSFYLIEEEHSQNKYFIKYCDEAHITFYKQAEEIALWLQDQKIKANAALDLKADCCFIYPFLDGTRLDCTPDTLNSLACSLADMHIAFKNYPLSGPIKEKTVYRMTLLNEVREQIAKGRLSIGPFPKYVKELARNKYLDFTQGSKTQVLHGDLHPGNMMKIGELIYFFDFEDTLHSYLPLVYELALVMERLIFVRNTSLDEVVRLGQHFLKSYKLNGGSYQYQDSDAYALQTLALRSLCVLTLCELEGNTIHEDEWYKFLNLSQLATRTQHVLKAILKV